MTNEGNQKQLVQIKIKARIFTSPDSTYPARIKPSKIEFTDAGEAKVIEFYFSIINSSKQELMPTLISSPKSLLAVVLPKSVPAGGYANGSVKLKNAGQKKGFEKSITIQFNDEANTRFTIPVKRGSGPSTVPAGKGQAGH